MRVIVFLYIVGLILNSEIAYSQNPELNLKIRDSKIEFCLNAIKKQSDFTFLYRSDLFNELPKVSIKKKNASLKEVLDELIVPLGFTYEIDDKTVIIRKAKAKTPINVDLEKKYITGKVTDSQGNTIPGVNVIIKNTTKGTITDNDGEYELEITDGTDVLIFSFVGYKTVEKDVALQTKVDVALVTDSKKLEEVVVIGYGIQRKSFVTGSSYSMKKEDFNKGAVVSPSEMMQGRVAGLQIIMNGGEPGSGSTVRIRGASSVRANQEPLYVIDGVALDITDATPSGASAAGINASATKNSLNFLNPEDIEKIDVLKDASATAIYGSRGANGVILITTKKGKSGADKLSYSGFGVISKLPKKLALLTADEYRKWYSDNGLLTRLDDQGANTDWQDEVFRIAYSQSHNLSYNGGSENSSFYSSLSYLDQEGIVKRTGLYKITGRINIEQDFFVKRLKIDGNISAARTTDKRVPIAETAGFEGDLLLTALKANPTFPVFNPDGTYYQATTSNRNAVAMINLTNDKTVTDRILANFGVTFIISTGLTYKLNLSVDHSNATRKVTQGDELSYLTNLGTANIANVELTSKLMENYITYNNKHQGSQFSFLLGHSFQTFQNLAYNIEVNNFRVQGIDYISNLGFGNSNQANVGSSRTENELQSFFARINYSFQGKYLFTSTLRADGSTKFGENNKYGIFPSVGVAWRIIEEKFIRESGIFSNLKLRLGWGLTGNQEIPNKISQLSLGATPGGNYYMNGTVVIPGTAFLRTPNPDIQWETTAQTNLGLDFGFISDRFYGSIDYFYKTTRDVLLQTTSIAPAPTVTAWRNIPEMQIKNRGIELQLTGIVIDNEGFTWTSGLNFSRIKNEVVDLPVDVIETGTASGAGLSNTNVQVIKSGYPIGTFWGKRFIGYDVNGNSLYKQNANGVHITENLGTALPDFTFGWNNTFTYKGFDLSFFVNGVYGNKVYNNTFNASLHIAGLSHGNNIPRDLLNSGEGINNTADYSSRFIEDGSFIRLSSATLEYSIPVTRVKNLKSFKIHITGTNLFLKTNYSGYDPEVNTNAPYQGVPSLGMDFTGYPMSRTVQFGIKIGI